jgi:hypothetical protein
MEAAHPELDEFKGHRGADQDAVQLKDIEKKLPLRVLSDEEWQHWITNGYVIVKQAVPRENVERLIEILWRFEEKDPNDPATWYTSDRRPHGRADGRNTLRKGPFRAHGRSFLRSPFIHQKRTSLTHKPLAAFRGALN